MPWHWHKKKNWHGLLDIFVWNFQFLNNRSVHISTHGTIMCITIGNNVWKLYQWYLLTVNDIFETNGGINTNG